ncbi:hypothetical protein BGZ95_005133 [Linnemannia exigua]|uniref:Uncharacterized protein n=1 Tax=Linnemannia exigua TaxID=604196 RepID=A0AAD4H0F7_9FUNG|nr:hypothetical protein BGZ95_005133 [Linnemannia exigua]
MILASIDTNFSLRVRELTEEVVGKGENRFLGHNGSYSDVQLMWSVGVASLSLKDVIMDDIVDLSDANFLLMKQRADDADNIEEWSETSTERNFEKWGYFDESDDKKVAEMAKEKEKEKESKEEGKEDGQKLKVMMKEPDGDSSDFGMVQALMKRYEILKRIEVIKRAAYEM